MAKAMLSAGARADHFNALTGQALVHVAAAQEGARGLAMLKILLDFLPDKPMANR